MMQISLTEVMGVGCATICIVIFFCSCMICDSISKIAASVRNLR